MERDILEEYIDMDMTELEEYQEFVASCPQPNGKEPKLNDPQFMKGYWAATQLNSEAGEVLELYEKAYRKDIDLDEEKVLDECGDTLWGIACILNTIGYTLDEAIEHNISKLSERHKINEVTK